MSEECPEHQCLRDSLELQLDIDSLPPVPWLESCQTLALLLVYEIQAGMNVVSFLTMRVRGNWNLGVRDKPLYEPATLNFLTTEQTLNIS